MQTLLVALTELTTSAVIFLYVPAIMSVHFALRNYSNEAKYVITLIDLLFIAIPLLGACQVSKRMLRCNSGYLSVDYRINLSFKCHELSTLTDMVRSRRRLVIVNIIYMLVTTSAMTFTLYYYDMNPLCIIPNISLTCYGEVVELHHRIYRMMFVILVWYTACIISFLQNTIELFFIFSTKKCFLNWAFKEGLEEIETVARIKEQERVDKLEEYNLFQRE